MSDTFDHDLPDALRAVRTRPLFVMRLDVRTLQVVGEVGGGVRRVGLVFGGSFAGALLSGAVLDGGSDWQTLRADGILTLDVRLVLRTTDGALIGMTYRGIRHGPADTLARFDAGEVVDPASYYFRIAPRFETPPGPHAWLNGVIAVGVGHRSDAGPIYSVFEPL